MSRSLVVTNEMQVHKSKLEHAPVGTRIWFLDEKRPYHVRARSWRYLICTKPFNLKHTVLYTVIDIVNGIRGTENLIFGAGAETTAHCEAMLERLMDGETEISHRNKALLEITFMKPASKRKTKYYAKQGS